MSSDYNKPVSQNQERVLIYKIIVIGDTNVGKTCLTYRFCEGKFPQKVEATIGADFREKVLVLNNQIVKLQIWDTAGQERFRRSMVPHYYRNAMAVVFVYDVTKKESLDNIPYWIAECDRHLHSTDDVIKIVVGNKCDETDKVVVSTEIAQKLADSFNMPLFETSAKLDSQADHIESIFMTITHKLQNKKNLNIPVADKKTGYVQYNDGRLFLTPSQRYHDAHEEETCIC